MKLYKILGGIAVICLIIGTASVCGAIEWRTSLKAPIGILVVGCVCSYSAMIEEGTLICRPRLLVHVKRLLVHVKRLLVYAKRFLADYKWFFIGSACTFVWLRLIKWLCSIMH